MCFCKRCWCSLLGGIGYVQLNPVWKFSGEMLVMLGGSMLLFQVLLRQGGRDLARMILIGVIFGIFFRSITGLLQRLMDPEAFAVAQAFSYAWFNSFNRQLLWPALLVVLISVPLLWRERHRLDVHLLGRDQAVNLGIAYQRHTLWLLAWVAVLVATATALVGPFGYPVSFFRPARLRAGQPFCRHAAPQCAPADGVSGGRAAAGGRPNPA